MFNFVVVGGGGGYGGKGGRGFYKGSYLLGGVFYGNNSFFCEFGSGSGIGNVSFGEYIIGGGIIGLFFVVSCCFWYVCYLCFLNDMYVFFFFLINLINFNGVCIFIDSFIWVFEVSGMCILYVFNLVNVRVEIGGFIIDNYVCMFVIIVIVF